MFGLDKVRGLNTTLQPPKLSVLTARATELKFALALKPKDKLCSAYRTTGEKHGFSDWGIGDVYYGSVVEWIFQDRKGHRKFTNFEKMLVKDDQNGRFQYVFIGDTGEKDEDAGERIVAKYGNRMKAVFLHAVSDSKDRSNIKIPNDRTLNGVPIFYFNTYVGAAVKAYQAKLISTNGLNRVVAEARSDLRRVGAAGNARRLPLRIAFAPAAAMNMNSGVDLSKWTELERDCDVAEAATKIKSRAL